jgi:hypothetical protein
MVDLKRRFRELDRVEAPDLGRVIELRARHLAAVPGALNSPETIELGGRTRQRQLRHLLAAAAIIILGLGLAAIAQHSHSTGPVRHAPTPTIYPAVGYATITLTESGCSYEGPATMRVQEVSVQMINRTADRFWIGMHEILPGHTFDELAAYIGVEQQRIAAGRPALGPPSFVTNHNWRYVNNANEGSGQAMASPRAGEQLNTDVQPGTYAFACGRIDASQDRELGVWVVGPLGVTR